TMYHNPKLYPGMYLWLYPYGLGGFENMHIHHRLDCVPHIHAQLAYGDRCFQTDRPFSYAVFSHEQMCGSYSGGYLLTKKCNFPAVVDKLHNVSLVAL
ncbi:hypothetical protein C8Q76DRAFT_602944, partial [Earliella scabrosa]